MCAHHKIRLKTKQCSTVHSLDLYIFHHKCYRFINGSLWILLFTWLRPEFVKIFTYMYMLTNKYLCISSFSRSGFIYKNSEIFISSIWVLFTGKVTKANIHLIGEHAFFKTLIRRLYAYANYSLNKFKRVLNNCLR